MVRKVERAIVVNNDIISRRQISGGNMKRNFFVVVILVLCLAGAALAQPDTARVIGTITDATGAVLPNATVTITDSGTGRENSTKTNGSGEYVFNALPIGKYHEEVRQEGFKTAAADFTLEVSQVLEIRSEEHTSELQSLRHLVCRLL